MSVRDLIQAELETLDEQHLDEAYALIRRFAQSKRLDKSASLMSKLRAIAITAPQILQRMLTDQCMEKRVSSQIFVDTGFVIALVNLRDQYHQQAVELADRIEGLPLLTTDAVLLEIGNSLCRNYKSQAVEVIQQFLSSEDVEIAHLTPFLFNEAFGLYRAYQDKAWSLVDCISFIVMRQANVVQALTFDQHFVQAGFQALMR